LTKNILFRYTRRSWCNLCKLWNKIYTTLEKRFKWRIPL